MLVFNFLGFVLIFVMLFVRFCGDFFLSMCFCFLLKIIGVIFMFLNFLVKILLESEELNVFFIFWFIFLKD